ncbi:MAG: hypothetical protein ACJAR0_001339 [Candidatus Azotimanducaceae bacterium]
MNKDLKKVVCGTVLMLLAGCNPAKQAVSVATTGVATTGVATTKVTATDYATLLTDYANWRNEVDPVAATSMGYSQYNHLFADNLSDRYLNDKTSSLKTWQARVQAMLDADITQLQKDELAILRYLIDTQLAGVELGIQPGTMYTLHPLHSYHRSTHHEFVKLARGTGSQPFNNKQDYADFLQRLVGFKVWLMSAQSRMEEAVALNKTLPRKIIIKMIPQFEPWISNDPAINPFYGSLSQFPAGVSEQDQRQIIADYSRFIETDLIPVFALMKRYLETEYLAHAQVADGLSAIEGGADLYAFLVQYWTTTDMTAEALHQRGLSEVARITEEMLSVKSNVGFEGSLPEFFTFINTDPQFFPFNTIDEVIQRHYRSWETMAPFVDALFSIQPKTPFEIRPVDAAIANAATANYDGPNLDGTRAGIFYDAIPDATQYNSFAMESLFLHEAIPGHHFQIALEMESVDIPVYRKTMNFGAFSEGWALYTESLGKALGLYTDPYQYMGRLQAEMLRAARLVVDTGLHTKGWTREQAIEYFRDVMPISEEEATVHIERYMVRPGQALSYKIGELKIQALRKRSEVALGDSFNLTDFHDLILAGGGMPLIILEARVEQWIESQIKH